MDEPAIGSTVQANDDDRREAPRWERHPDGTWRRYLDQDDPDYNDELYADPTPWSDLAQRDLVLVSTPGEPMPVVHWYDEAHRATCDRNLYGAICNIDCLGPRP